VEGLPAGRLQGRGESVDAVVGGGERVVRGEHRLPVGAGEVDRAVVAGQGVAVVVLDGHGDGLSHARGGGGGVTADSERVQGGNGGQPLGTAGAVGRDLPGIVDGRCVLQRDQAGGDAVVEVRYRPVVPEHGAVRVDEDRRAVTLAPFFAGAIVAD